MNKVKEPKIKAGDKVKNYNGHEYKVLKVSNTYDEIEMYDETGICQCYSTEERLEEFGLDPENILYCAVDNSPVETIEKYVRTFVFLITRDSGILGE
jgi:sulfur relay (sulfurtransferase) DsrF/TusC family protein